LFRYWTKNNSYSYNFDFLWHCTCKLRDGPRLNHYNMIIGNRTIEVDSVCSMTTLGIVKNV